MFTNKRIQRINIETGELLHPTNKFYQFYKNNFWCIRTLVTRNPNAAKIFFFLIENMDSSNTLIISSNALGEALGMGRTNVWKATKFLKASKYLNIYKSGSTNIYCINSQLVWQQSQNLKKFAKFSASVYITESEQEILGETKKIGHFEIKPKNQFGTNTLFENEL